MSAGPKIKRQKGEEEGRRNEEEGNDTEKDAFQVS
jgi:hypothetical protein